MKENMNSKHKFLAIPLIIMSVLVMAAFGVSCGKQNVNEKLQVEKDIQMMKKGFTYTETEISLPMDYDPEYIAEIMLDENEQIAMYSYTKDKEGVYDYYVSILQEDGTWKKEKAIWNDNLKMLQDKVGHSILKMVVGDDGNIYAWMLKKEKVNEGEEEDIYSNHLLRITTNGYIEEVLIKDLGDTLEKCTLSNMNGFHVLDENLGIFAGNTWSTYDMKVGI